jgi:multiple sugar transport system permease protein
MIESVKPALVPHRERAATTRRRWRHRKASPLAVVVALALLVYYAIIFIIPFGVGIWLSFQNWDFIVDPKFVGWRNYERALDSPYFWQSVRTTLIFSVAEITIALLVTLTLAFVLSRLRSVPQRVFLGLFYLPVITPSVVTVLLWRWLYLPNNGGFNAAVEWLHLPQQPFLSSNSQALWAIVAMVVWANFGTGTVLYLAGINEIPDHLLEAATLDGATVRQQFMHIILPLLRPIIFFNVVVSIIATVQMFEQFYLMSGPGFSTRTVALYTYELGFQSVDLGYGAAVSMLMFIGLLAVTIIQFWRFRSANASA